FSVTPGSLRCERVKGEVSTGKCLTNIGPSSWSSHKSSQISSTNLPWPQPPSFGTSRPTTLASSLSSSTVESMVTSFWPGNFFCSASFRDGYISIFGPVSPPRSYSVTSASVTTCDPQTSLATVLNESLMDIVMQ